MKRLILLALFAALAVPSHAHGVLVFERPSTGSVFAAHNDGTKARRVARGSAPLVSPNGRYVAFERVVSSDGLRVDLFVKRLPNGKLRRVVRNYGRRPLVWSRDSKRVLAAGWTADGLAAYMINVRTWRRHVIDTSDEMEAAAFSPNGRTIVLDEAARDTGGLYAIPPGSFREPGAVFALGSAPVWGSAGLAYEVDDCCEGSMPSTYSDVVVRRFVHSEPRTVLHTHSDFARPVGWSADGTTLLAAEETFEFEAPREATAVLVTAETGETRTLSPVFSAVNGLSRDGGQVLAEQNGDVVTATVDGNVRLLAANATSPSWTR